MNIESQITQIRMIEAESVTVEWYENQAAKLRNDYANQVKQLEKSFKIKSDEDVEKVIERLAEYNTPVVADSFGAVGASVLATTEAALSWDGLLSDFNPVSMSQNQLKGLALAEKLDGKKLTAHLDTAIGSQVRKDIRNARIKGVGIDKMTSQIWNSLGGQVSKRNIETVARTYTATASSYAKRLTYKENEDIIKGYRWCATLENGNWKTGRGTCPRCAALDQQEYKSINDVPSFPLHRNCRCFPIPITKTWKELGLDVQEMEEAYRPLVDRAENGRKREAYGTTDLPYGDWWLSQNKKWQDSSTVGPTRAKYIRDGLIRYEDIVDHRNGDLLTLKQLMKKYNIKDS